MARGCALIDSRLDTAKICSDGRVHVDHAQLPAVFGGEKTFSHGLDPKRTSTDRTAVDDHAALASRLSIWLRSTSKSIGLVSSASAPPSKAFRSVSASPYAVIIMTGTSGR